MTHRAKGLFEVTLKPLTDNDPASGARLGRMSIDKQFVGDIIGTSKGEMLTAMTDVKGSAGYVAIERVIGTVMGRKGSFVLQHSGLMNRGAAQLSVTVVPDSGTDELVGITGQFVINIVDGKHFYELEYSLPK